MTRNASTFILCWFFQACAAYEVRQTEIVNREVGKLKEATTLMNELLSSMNLPGTRFKKFLQSFEAD